MGYLCSLTLNGLPDLVLLTSSRLIVYVSTVPRDLRPLFEADLFAGASILEGLPFPSARLEFRHISSDVFYLFLLCACVEIR